MMHMVVFEALGRYAKTVVDAGIEKTREQFGPDHMINPDAWFAACKELHEELEARLGPRRK